MKVSEVIKQIQQLIDKCCVQKKLLNKKKLKKFVLEDTVNISTNQNRDYIALYSWIQ